MSYADRLKIFENVENLGGKAWEHAVICDFLTEHGTIIKDCSPHCFHYQQIIEMLIKHAIETKTESKAYSKTHNLEKILGELINDSTLKLKNEGYALPLQVITTCAESYRYNFLLSCSGYRMAVAICDDLIDELLEFLRG
jgi:hypothetical protein